MKKLLAALFVFALCVMAADFWAKPSTEWSDKELQKMMANSPWARSYSLGQPGGAVGGDSAPAPISEGGGGGRGRGGGGGGGGGGAGALPGGAAGNGGPSISIVARWQSALPVKQAFVRLKYGAEAATSPDAKKSLEREETNYEIVLSGPFGPLLRSGNPETMKKGLMEASSLSAKGKDVMPTDVEIGAKDMLFTFPRTTAFTLDDKEVEFSTKLGEIALKYKFKLKDMVYNGKLEL
jgi:hypothetical protein